MKNGEEVRMWLCGTECELRPVSGATFLLAHREAKQMIDEFGGDETADELISAACLAAQGVYADGERLFETGNDVLNGMTPEEILEVAGEYTGSWMAAMKVADALEEGKEKPAGKPLNWVLDETAQEKQDTAEKELQYLLQNRILSILQQTEKPADSIMQTDAKKEENVVQQGKSRENGGVIPGNSPVAAEDEAGSQVSLQAKKITVDYRGRSDMEAVSNFFERDCRRYDGAFRRY